MKKQKKSHLKQMIDKDVNISKRNSKKKMPKTSDATDWRVVDRNKEKIEEMKLQKQYEKSRREQMLEANVDEDKEIKKLAKHLKLDKKKNIGKSFVDDGLDCILFLNNYYFKDIFFHTHTKKKKKIQFIQVFLLGI